MSRMPACTADIDAAWLTEALRAGGAIDGSTSVASVATNNMGPGIGFMGEVGRLDVAYSGGSGPSTVICKIPTQDATVRGLLAPARVFEREARFYLDVAPMLDVVPKAHSVVADFDADEYVLVLQDLGHLRVGDQSVGVTAAEAHAAVRALARFHARFWNSPDLDAIEWMPRINDEGMKIGSEIYRASLPGFLQVFAHAIDPDMVPVMERFADNVHQLLDRFAAMPTTIVHFDYRLDNLFFGSGDEVWMIDFQACSKGGGAFDLGYFISQSVPVAVRESEEAALLRAYHGELVARGVSDYAFDDLLEDYRVGVLYGWIIPVYAVGTLDSSSERAMALWTAVIERAQSAMRHHRVHELMI